MTKKLSEQESKVTLLEKRNIEVQASSTSSAQEKQKVSSELKEAKKVFDSMELTLKQKTEKKVMIDQETQIAKTKSRQITVQTEREHIKAEKKFKKLEEKVKQSCFYCKFVQQKVMQREVEITQRFNILKTLRSTTKKAEVDDMVR